MAEDQYISGQELSDGVIVIPSGVVGPRGVQGEQGEKGDKGDQGDQGIQGEQGIPGVDGVDGQGVPAGGLADQFLQKISAIDYDTRWADGTGSGGSGYTKFWVVATPDAASEDKAAADHVLVAGAGIAADLASQLQSKRQVLLVGNEIVLDDVISLPLMNNLHLKGASKITIIVDDSQPFTGSSNDLAGTGAINLSGS